jgi:hypothetical protein
MTNMAGRHNYQTSPRGFDEDDEPTQKRPPSWDTRSGSRARPQALAAIPTCELIPIEVDVPISSGGQGPAGEPKSGIVRSSKPRIDVVQVSVIPVPPPVDRRRPGLLIAAIFIVGFLLLAAGIALNADALQRLTISSTL